MFLSEPSDSAITFAQPADNSSFGASLRVLANPGPMSDLSASELDPTLQAAINRGDAAFLNGVVAAERQMRLVETINGRSNALAEAAENRIETARRLTGVVLENPFRGGYDKEARERAPANDLPDRTGSDDAHYGKVALDIFNEKIDALAQSFPDKAAGLSFGQTFDEQSRAIAASAEQGNADTGFVAAIAGGLWGARRDPLFLASFFVGPGPPNAAGALARIGIGALKQGLFNAGAALIAQPEVQAWRRTIGEKSGVIPALENVGMAFLFGAIPGAGIEGVREISRAGRQSLERIAGGVPKAGDVETAAKAIGVDLDDTTTRAVRAAENDIDNGVAGVGDAPAGIAPETHADVTAQAVRHAEDPATAPPPDIAIVAPARPADQVRILDEALPAKTGDREIVDGKPVTFARFDPATLQTDAATFQYKGGGDAAGVTDRLRHVTKWDPLASGKMLIFERLDGARFAADGHQRLGLAKRIDEPRPGMVRMYHGGLDTDLDTALWFSSQRSYAEGYANKSEGGRVFSVDIPEDHPLIIPNWPDQSIKAGFHRNVELPADLARNRQPVQTIKLDGFVFREADGWTPSDVRAMAAKKNMQEGSGDALDAARILRERPDLLDGSLPVSSPMMKNAIAIARLSDEAFGMAINGVVPPNHAAAVGMMVPDKLQHAAVLSDLVRFKPETDREARVLIGEILSSGFRAEEQINLFGAASATRSLMGERVKVLDQALSSLVKDKKLFGTLAEKADAIEAAGNNLARGVNEARARDASALSDMLTRLAQRTGPVSDALNRAAAQMADGVRPGKAADAFLDEVRQLLDRDGLSGLLASPELKPSLVVEPGTPDALAAAETGYAARQEASRSLFDEPQADAPTSEKIAPVSPQAAAAAVATTRQWVEAQRGITVDQLHVRATILQARMVEAEADITAAGGTFLNPGQKKLETLADKIGRKGYVDAGDIADAARAGVSVETPGQADAAIAALKQRFEIVDEGWKINAVGYADRKVLVRGADGTIGEFQIIPAPMYEAKSKLGGQKIYTQSRGLRPGPELDALDARQAGLYSAASARLEASWSGILDRSSPPNIGSNTARQSASDITPAVSATSRSSTDDQGAPGLSTANANLPSDSTAGRRSQLQNVRGMDENMLPAGDPVKPGLVDSVAVAQRPDARDVQFISQKDALDAADRPADHADLVKACKE